MNYDSKKRLQMVTVTDTMLRMFLAQGELLEP